jgi:hypothetical protein
MPATLSTERLCVAYAKILLVSLVLVLVLAALLAL